MPEVIRICALPATHVLILSPEQRQRGAPCLLKELGGVQAAGVARLRLRAPRHARPDAQPACRDKQEGRA